ncbi:beta and beta-prime subunits of DNA dependent RNA-polymerase [Babesia gibsoni]|uniref:DNA-directed RNA polymerase subunit n=1 Tax=Babesia gibsoni TaxID=33632 RepID=A0AAD8PDH8_BABGI|nr:beta and beta-prime subunits of DNA dependent RNA-polymerase [Babesia gibsoni]
MLKYDTAVSTEVSGLSFELLPSDAIRKLSVSEINNPERHGSDCAEKSCIHDTALGGSDISNICSTCNEVAACDGHLGHIEFPLPLYHPLFLAKLSKILKSMCLYCKKLKYQKHRVVKFIKLFGLIEAGLMSEMLLFDKSFPDNEGEKQSDSRRLSGWINNTDAAPSSLPSPPRKKKGSKGSESSSERRGKAEQSAEKRQFLDSIMRKLKLYKGSSESNINVDSMDEAVKRQLVEIDQDIPASGVQTPDVAQPKRAKSINDMPVATKMKDVIHVDFNLWNEVRNRFFNDASAVTQCPHCGRKDMLTVRPSNDFSSIEISWPHDVEGPPIVDNLSSYTNDMENEVEEESLTRDAMDSAKQGVDVTIVNKLSSTGKSIRSFQAQAFHIIPFLKSLFAHNSVIMGYLFPQSRKVGWKLFIMFCMGVPANRFRPPLLTAERQIALHARSSALLDIILAKEILRVILQIGSDENLSRCMKDNDYVASMFGSVDPRQLQNFRDFIGDSGSDFNAAVLSSTQALQRKVSAYTDSSKGVTPMNAQKSFLRPGIKQSLEHKEGTVRQNMLGKRVNYAARTVIAPDCFLEPNQMGIPLMFATELTIPENVTAYNVNLLRRLLVNGPKIYPGANFYRDENGKLYNLGALSFSERKAKAKLLLTDNADGKLPRVVYRHVLDGDVVLMNRQPTLHKPGIMGHFVKVLTNQKIFRLNYVNCNTYNADFDGDEMNLHLPQDPLARSEAQLITNADCHFTVPKDGQPIRGLIQDHCLGGAYLTCRDTFLTKEQYFTLVYVAVQSFFKWHRTVYIKPDEDRKVMHDGFKLDLHLHQLTKRLKVLSDPYARRCASANSEIHIEPPAIMFPRALWTGKQVITTLLKTMVDGIARGLHSTDVKFLRNYKGINLLSKSKTPGDSWGGAFDGNREEGNIIIQNSELLQGVLDKSQFGASSYGLTHLVYELLGPRASGCLLNSFSYLFTSFLRMHGATCSPKDFILTSSAEVHRNRILRRIRNCGIHLQAMFISAISNSADNRDMKKSDDAKGVLNAAALEVFQQMYADLKQYPQLTSKLKKMPVTTVEDVEKVLTVLVGHLDGKPLEFAQRKDICSVIGRTVERLCNIPELRGYVLGQIPSLVRPSDDNTTGIDTFVKKHFPSWHKTYDGDGKVARSSDDLIYKLGDSGEACTEMYRLINMQFKGNEHAFYRMFDRFFQSNITGASSDVSSIVDNTLLKFPSNGFAGMVYTGAKGSKVNFSMICTFLAQQTLEGRRVPVMPSLRTLPSFAFGDLGSRAGGFITDRFLTGLRPQEYFFHCMSGREGLVDTCVKTAKSGYLQRCILKAMEDVICCYDSTVRSADGTVIQFAYGEDGIDVQKSAYLSRPNDIIQNAPLIKPGQKDELSPKAIDQLAEVFGNGVDNIEHQKTLYQHYLRAQCEPGEAVGVIAGQSIGEPATQMTLNTFHLAGHGATNVTLGIPRLVEILQTTGNASTPYFSAPIIGNTDDIISKNAQFAINALRTVPLTDVIHSVAVEEDVYIDSSGETYYEYEASVQFENLSHFRRAVGSIKSFDILRLTAHCLLNGFLKKVTGLMIVTMDSNVPYEVSDNTDYLNECWRRIVLQEHVHKKDKLSERIRKMALSAGGSSSAVGTTSTSKVSIYTGEGLEIMTSSQKLDDEGVNASNQNDYENEEVIGTIAEDDDDPDLDTNSDKESSDPESSDEDDRRETSLSAADESSTSDAEEVTLIDANDMPAPAHSGVHKDGSPRRVNGEQTPAYPKMAVVDESSEDCPYSKQKDSMYQGFERDVKIGKQNLNSVNMKVFQFAKTLRYCPDTGRMTLKFGWPAKKCPYHLNMLPLLKNEISAQILRNSPGVKQARVVCSTENDQETYNLHCDGTNLQRLFLLKEDLVDFNRIQINDVGTVLRYYGVEAARACIVKELQKVFSVYGINVDYRHLSLIADFMTNRGDIRTFNRYGMARHASPLLQMSFESTMKCIIDACERGGYDNLGTPAGSIIVGRPIMLGGGLCKVLPYIKLKSNGYNQSNYPSSAVDYEISKSRGLGVDSFVLDN